MFKQFIDKVDGADIYMVSSFVTFMVFFVLVGIYLIISDKKSMQEIAQLPLN